MSRPRCDRQPENGGWQVALETDTLEALFENASRVFATCSVDNLDDIGPAAYREFEKREKDLSVLLSLFLKALADWKLNERLLLAEAIVRVKLVEEGYELRAVLRGDTVEAPSFNVEHVLVEELPDGWKAVFALRP